MSLRRCFDAAFPPKTVPPGCGAVLGYIGGRAAANVWSLEDWRPFGHLRQFPCWVADTSADPVISAQDAVKAARPLGWRPGRALVADMETSNDRGWYTRFAGKVTALGFVPVAYGSLSSVLELAADVVWAADWTFDPVVPPGQTIAACQYADNQPWDGTHVDYSVLEASLFLLGGQGVRRAP